jgi:hypothetical protein
MHIVQMLIKLQSQIKYLNNEIVSIKQQVGFVPEWLPVGYVYSGAGYKSRDGFLSRLRSGEFEPEVDFRKHGPHWEVNTKILARISRKQLVKDKIMLLSVPPMIGGNK